MPLTDADPAEHPAVVALVNAAFRGTGAGQGWTTEADYLNGEIAMLGRQSGVPTPANSTLQALMRVMATNRIAPQSIPADDIRSLIANRAG